MTDIVERLRGKANWQAREGRSLRLHCPNSPSMPELAETHEESADSMREAADEIERLREALTLYRAENGCTRGQRTTQWCGEATRLRRAWLRTIQAENACPATGGGCLSQQCGCVAEMDALLNEGDK